MPDFRSRCFLWGAVGDAYGSAHEFSEGVPNDLTYHDHPRHGAKSLYTDDTQQAVAVANWLVCDGKSPLALANHLVHAYRQDVRGGYSRRMKALLDSCEDGADLMVRVDARKNSSGAIMRAWPCGFLRDPHDVCVAAYTQARLTHAEIAAEDSVILATMFHACYYRDMEAALLFYEHSAPERLRTRLSNRVENDSTSVLKWVVHILKEFSDPRDRLVASVDAGGDVDTLASIVMAFSALDGHYRGLPQNLLDGIECGGGVFGKDYLVATGEMMTAGFPRNG